MRSALAMIAVIAACASGVSYQSNQDPDPKELAQEYLWTVDAAAEWIEWSSFYTKLVGGYLSRLEVGNIGEEWKGDRDEAKRKLDEIVEVHEALTETLQTIEDQLKTGELRIGFLYTAHVYMVRVSDYLLDVDSWFPLFADDDDDTLQFSYQLTEAGSLMDEGHLLSDYALDLERCLYGVALWHEADKEHPVLREQS